MTEIDRAGIGGALRALKPDEFLILSEPRLEPVPRRGLAKLLPASVPPTRFAQVMRLADDEPMLAEAVGAKSFGGDYELSDAADRELRALGWLAPGDAEWEEIGGPLYRRWLPLEDLDAVADLMLRTLDVMGADRSTLQIRTGG